MVKIDMPMPKRCCECGFYEPSIIWQDSGLCRARKGAVVVTGHTLQKQEEHCPLISVDRKEKI